MAVYQHKLYRKYKRSHEARARLQRSVKRNIDSVGDACFIKPRKTIVDRFRERREVRALLENLSDPMLFDGKSNWPKMRRPE